MEDCNVRRELLKRFLILFISPIVIVLFTISLSRDYEERNATYAVPVFVTETGECYHSENCPMIQGKAVTCIPIYQTSWSTPALRPCSVCNPDEQDIDTIRFSDPAKATRNAIITVALICAEALFFFGGLVAVWFIELFELLKQYWLTRKSHGGSMSKKLKIVLSVLSVCFMSAIMLFIGIQIGKSISQNAAQEPATVAVVATAQQTNNGTSGEYVYVTPSGKKYHKQDCWTLSKSKNLTKLTVEEAESKRYDPCSICFDD